MPIFPFATEYTIPLLLLLLGVGAVWLGDSTRGGHVGVHVLGLGSCNCLVDTFPA